MILRLNSCTRLLKLREKKGKISSNFATSRNGKENKHAEVG